MPDRGGVLVHLVHFMELLWSPDLAASLISCWWANGRGCSNFVLTYHISKKRPRRPTNLCRPLRCPQIHPGPFRQHTPVPRSAPSSTRLVLRALPSGITATPTGAPTASWPAPRTTTAGRCLVHCRTRLFLAVMLMTAWVSWLSLSRATRQGLLGCTFKGFESEGLKA
ncbi:hypothetical protein BDV06DRAFT_125962 [Aspergillus oleicola]